MQFQFAATEFSSIFCLDAWFVRMISLVRFKLANKCKTPNLPDHCELTTSPPYFKSTSTNPFITVRKKWYCSLANRETISQEVFWEDNGMFFMYPVLGCCLVAQEQCSVIVRSARTVKGHQDVTDTGQQ